ncbi:MAG: glycosyltransferase family 2 protein [Bacteroidia bacterium]
MVSSSQKIAVVILNWNGKKHLQEFLPSVVTHTPSCIDIVVADNGSTDDSIKFVKENFPSIIITKNPKNGGFAKGYNDALKQINADIYILLNSDVEVSSNWIEPLIERLNSNDLVAACQPKILSYKEKNKFEHAGAAGGFIDKFGFAFCRGRIFDSIEDDNHQYQQSTEIFWATGACMAIKADLFHQVGGFDEEFFAHMEEIDLCWRLKNNGYQIWYEANSTVYHLGGGTLNYDSPQKIFLNFRNNLFLITKNKASNFIAFDIFIRLILDGIAGIFFLVNGNTKGLIAVLKAHFAYYTSLGKMLQKRKQIIQKENLSGIYTKSIVWNYFIKKKRKFSELVF